MNIAQVLVRAKKRDWFLAASAAFALTVLNCMYLNRENAIAEDARFWQFTLVSFVAFASLMCVFLLKRFWMAAPLITAGGVGIFLVSPEVRALYLYMALPAILTVFFLRYIPLTEKPGKWNIIMHSVYLIAALAVVICLLRELVSSGGLYFRNFLPFTNLFGRFEDNHYGLSALIILFALYAVFGFRQAGKTISANTQNHTGQKKRGRKTRRIDFSRFALAVWLRYAAVCLFFLFVILNYSLFYDELFLPVPSFVNLTAIFVVAAQMVSYGTVPGTSQEA